MNFIQRDWRDIVTNLLQTDTKSYAVGTANVLKFSKNVEFVCFINLLHKNDDVRQNEKEQRPEGNGSC